MFALAFISLPALSATTLTSNELCQEFKDDGDEAGGRYTRNRVIVSGEMSYIKSTYKYWSIRLRCNSKQTSFKAVSLRVDNKYSEQLKPLEKAHDNYGDSSDHTWMNSKKGSDIQFSCKYDKMNRIGVYLKECRIY